jgi:hypothetical protein
MEGLIASLITKALEWIVAQGGPMVILALVCWHAHKAILAVHELRNKDKDDIQDTLVDLVKGNTEAKQELKSAVENQTNLINMLLSAIHLRKRA